MNDLDQISQQEAALQFDHFDARTAWAIGSRLREVAEAMGVAVAIDVSLWGQALFFHAMPGTTPDNAEWIRRKRAVVQRFHSSSYAVGLQLAAKGETLEALRGLPTVDFAAHGGSFPVKLRGSGCIGAITVSGLPQRQDHALVVAVLAEFLGKETQQLALPE